jgi:hypothetical protein
VKKQTFAFYNVAMVPERLMKCCPVHCSCRLYHNFICIFSLIFKVVQDKVVSALQFMKRSPSDSVKVIETFYRVNIKTILPEGFRYILYVSHSFIR